MFEINTVTIILGVVIIAIALAYLLYKQVEDVSVLILNLLFPILILLSFYTLFMLLTRARVSRVWFWEGLGWDLPNAN